MAFNFELSFTGLIVFCFPDAGPSKGHALLVRDEGDGRSTGHRPALVYDHTQLDRSVRPVPGDALYTGLDGKRFGVHELRNEVVEIQPVFRRGSENQALNVARDPDHGMQLTAVLSELDDAVADPVGGNLVSGIDSRCLQPSLAKDSPAIARLDFSKGRLAVEDTLSDVHFRRGPQLVRQNRELARKVTLTLRNLTGLTIRSSPGDWRLDFDGNLGLDEVCAVLTNEDRQDFRDTAPAIPHFGHLYSVLERPPVTPVLGYRSANRPAGVLDRICPSATYALP